MGESSRRVTIDKKARAVILSTTKEYVATHLEY